MKKMKFNKNQKIICAVVGITVVAVATVAISVKMTHIETESQAISESSTPSVVSFVSESVAESAVEAVTVSTSETTTIAKTTQKITTTKKAETTANKTESAQKDEDEPFMSFDNIVSGPFPYPQDTGGFYVVRRDADNLYKDPNGGYLMDVWAIIANNKYNNPIYDEPFQGRLRFTVEDREGNFLTSDIIDVGILQPGESRKGTVTVHVDENQCYVVTFYYA